MKKSTQLTYALNEFYHKPIAKASLELFFTIGLVTFLGFFAIQPTLVTMSNLLKEIEDKQTLNEQLQRKIAALTTAQIEYAQAEEDLIFLDQALPMGPRMLENLKIIEKTATEANVVISSLSMNEIPEELPPGTPRTQLTRIALPIRVTVTGDYVSIRNFVELLLANRRTFITDTVSFSIIERSSQQSLQATITLNTPYYGLEKSDDAE